MTSRPPSTLPFPEPETTLAARFATSGDQTLGQGKISRPAGSYAFYGFSITVSDGTPASLA